MRCKILPFLLFERDKDRKFIYWYYFLGARIVFDHCKVTKNDEWFYYYRIYPFDYKKLFLRWIWEYKNAWEYSFFGFLNLRWHKNFLYQHLNHTTIFKLIKGYK